MFRAVFEFWYGVPVLLRVCLSLVLIGVSVLTLLVGDGVWITPGVIGLAMLLFCGAGGNSSGYNF